VKRVIFITVAVIFIFITSLLTAIFSSTRSKEDNILSSKHSKGSMEMFRNVVYRRNIRI
jgi:hypothetical protein